MLSSLVSRLERQVRAEALLVRILKGVARWGLVVVVEVLVAVFVLLPAAVLMDFAVKAGWVPQVLVSLLGL